MNFRQVFGEAWQPLVQSFASKVRTYHSILLLFVQLK